MLKLENDACVMMLPLVVVGRTPVLSAVSEANEPPPRRG